MRDKLSRQMGLLVVGALLLVLAGFTRFSATVWSSHNEMVAASAQKAPTSARAQAELAVVLFNAGQHEQSLQVLDHAVKVIPNDNPLLLLNRLVIRCNLRVLQPHELDAVVMTLSPKIYDPRYLKHYADLLQALSGGRCPGVELEQLRPLFTGMLQNPANSQPDSPAFSHIKYLAGSVDLQVGNIDAAMPQFLASLEAKPDAGSAMTMAAMVATAGYPKEALLLSERALEYLDVESRGVRLGLKVTEKDILEFRAIVTAEIQGTAE
jgi:tetratricopeptide (TPR) repeat protein